ncbi:MAG: hypothetical protein COZ06_27955 [Armatimonadetes bacterium CG_4_10_14_3_um_filter_66_18]|nr:hypothetical protein [Armatimonadota bacterium]OIP06439.1 MAG: hypothetical protein AUJ96_09035 [Armatimonadetes bacterium CG2_30_66_41]PIW13115.1 MAG: hypothetical protein COW34_11400 [Armatimonadetes bacterium CG17_big_fil_post_rev_8_21_14_2_50_66_6]PIY40591.1 MAG: hypothetical protein COZ06_27955 [Armatimonadetes bacterium CG_4_10_14_3_um_filter_66_18]PIZ46885.1 MAG: hypothetical protein COY42_09760 [Armatimonadetes bacterium CG_4_10_14_0_8_um_filter_66_14]PJB61827.1 MAG: hypothetical pr
MKNLKPIYNVIVCTVAALLLAWGLFSFSPAVMIAATIVTGLVTLGLAALRFSATKTASPLLLGLTALWLLTGKPILRVVAGRRVADEVLAKGDAATWASYAVIAGALLLIMLSLALVKTRPGAAAGADDENE